MVPRNYPAPSFFSFNEALSFCQGALAQSGSFPKLVFDEDENHDEEYLVLNSDPCGYRAHRISQASCEEVSISQQNLDLWLYVDPYAHLHREREERNLNALAGKELENQETQRLLTKIGLIVLIVIIFFYMKP